MADQKVTELTADTSPTSDDLVVTVNDPSGTPGNKKVTLATLGLAGAWTPWTPTLSGGWNATGNATFDCKYIQLGKTVIARVSITNGTTTTYQSGNMTFTLPVNTTTFGSIGSSYCEHSGTGYLGTFMPTSGSTVFLVVGGSGGSFVTSNVANNTTPFTWTTGDFIQGIMVYEAA